MGTDNSGRDMLARVLQVCQISLMVGIIATVMSCNWNRLRRGCGYLGAIDNLMMRFVDILYSLPYVILVLSLLAMFRRSTPVGQLALLFLRLARCPG